MQYSKPPIQHLQINALASGTALVTSDTALITSDIAYVTLGPEFGDSDIAIIASEASLAPETSEV